MKLTYQALLDDPRLMDAILVNARRERAQVVHRVIVAPIKKFFDTRRHAAHAPREIRYIRGRVA
jgi:hypothetical protein